MHSMWKGAISFGLVMIPVRLYAATEQNDLAFRQVHRPDGGRIKFRRFCSVCGEEVPYQDVAKGYELPTGEVVILDEDDLSSLPLPTMKSIEVLQFAPAEQIDPILFNRSYYIEPEASGARAYVLLRDALEASGRVAVAQVALRQRESLATVRCRDGVLVLETLLWPDEVRTATFGFQEQDVEVRPAELRMARSLIDSMTADFEPTEHHDRYREALTGLIEAKVRGAELLAPEPIEIAAGPAANLTEALRASLAAVQGSAAGGSGAGGSGAGGSGAGGSAEDGGGAEESGTAKPRARRSASGTSTRGRSGAAKPGAARSGVAKSGAAKPGAARSGSAKPGSAGKQSAGRRK
ncbi:MAG: Ku protein [Actinomycetota bacterium]|jgi:DNA end-binding protein Ku|nr:Ku protein [Actinomycetota bacterium]